MHIETHVVGLCVSEPILLGCAHLDPLSLRLTWRIDTKFIGNHSTKSLCIIPLLCIWRQPCIVDALFAIYRQAEVFPHEIWDDARKVASVSQIFQQHTPKDIFLTI